MHCKCRDYCFIYQAQYDTKVIKMFHVFGRVRGTHSFVLKNYSWFRAQEGSLLLPWAPSAVPGTNTGFTACKTSAFLIYGTILILNWYFILLYYLFHVWLHKSLYFICRVEIFNIARKLGNGKKKENQVVYVKWHTANVEISAIIMIKHH